MPVSLICSTLTIAMPKVTKRLGQAATRAKMTAGLPISGGRLGSPGTGVGGGLGITTCTVS